jgi:hypothetical protein
MPTSQSFSLNAVQPCRLPRTPPSNQPSIDGNVWAAAPGCFGAEYIAIDRLSARRAVRNSHREQEPHVYVSLCQLRWTTAGLPTQIRRF